MLGLELDRKILLFVPCAVSQVTFVCAWLLVDAVRTLCVRIYVYIGNAIIPERKQISNKREIKCELGELVAQLCGVKPHDILYCQPTFIHV